jgi:hypothetical protein
MTAEIIGDASDDVSTQSAQVIAEVIDLEAARQLSGAEIQLRAATEQASAAAAVDFAEWQTSGRLDYMRWAGRMGYAAVVVQGYQGYRETWLGLHAAQNTHQAAS